jgi:hypothetical protein
MPATQNPSADPTMPTITFAISPIWALVFMTMLASHPTMPPMTKLMIRFMGESFCCRR